MRKSNIRLVRCCECRIDLLPWSAKTWNWKRPPWNSRGGKYLCKHCWKKWNQWAGFYESWRRAMEEVHYHIQRILPNAPIYVTDGRTNFVVIDQVGYAQGIVRDFINKNYKCPFVARTFANTLEEIYDFEKMPETWQDVVDMVKEAEMIEIIRDLLEEKFIQNTKG